VSNRIIIIIYFITSAFSIHAQSNEGKDFWFGFMEHYDVNDNTKVVMITSKYSTSGTVGVPNINWSQNYSVDANEVTIITLPNSTENIGSEVLNNVGVQVTSEKPVSVYIHQYHNSRSEASVVLPLESLGKEYYVMTYQGVIINGQDHPSEFLIVGVEDETIVTITLSDNSKGVQNNGSTFNVLLNQGETYQLQSRTGTGDLSGTRIIGDKDIAVFAGNTWTEVPNGCAFRDNLLEQMFPVNTWGKKVVTVPNDKVSYDVFRVMAAENDTHVEVSGDGSSQSYTIDAGEYIEYKESSATFIEADNPVQVAQFNIGSTCGGHYIGDPSMVLLNSIEQRRDTVTLYNSSFQRIDENFINIVVSTEDVSQVTLDGFPIPASAKTGTVGTNNEFTYYSIQVTSGAHTIISQACGVIATAYGYGELESYAYGGGASFNSINSNPIPEGGCLNDTVFFDAQLPDSRYSFLWNQGGETLSNEKQFNHYFPELGHYPIELIITDKCQQTRDTLNRNLLISLRQAVEVEGDEIVCERNEINLMATDLPGANYEWVGPVGFVSEQQAPVIKLANKNMSGEYSAIGIVSGCATYPATITVDIIERPNPNLGPDTIFCLLEGEIILDPGEFDGYRWQDGSRLKTYSVLEEGAYSVEVEDKYGCTSIDSVYLNQLCPTEIFIPNAFSPNDDGNNDFFEIFGHDIININLRIFDRWGSIVYKGEGETEMWDGSYNGRKVPSGVYVWSIEVEGYKKDGAMYKETLTGTVTVVH
jgi:gliding motility-associated-like protein